MINGPSQSPSTIRHILEMEDVCFSWRSNKPFSLSVSRFCLKNKEQMLLTGPSGGGKSTLLSLISGVIIPHSGRIRILNTNTTQLTSKHRDRFRGEHMGIVFQMFNLLPYATVSDNILLPLYFSKRRWRQAGGSFAKKEAKRLCVALGLDATLLDARAGNLSIGQQQRVACARALIGRPELIIADEPTSSLDQSNRHAFLDLLFAEVEAAGSSLLMVSHDETLARRFQRVERLSSIATATFAQNVA